MSWTLEYNDDLDIVILTYKGLTTGPEIKEAATARIDMGNRMGTTNFLIDTRLTLADESATLDIYDIPKRLYSDEHVQHVSRIAIIEPESPTTKEMVKFFENACLNRGWIVMSFSEYESAISWLLPHSSNHPPDSDRIETISEE